MKKTVFSVLFGMTFGVLHAAPSIDCAALSVSVKNTVAAHPSKVLEIVSADVAAAPACACEVVKAAIKASKANTQTVAAIVEAAATAAPDQVQLISRCAEAVAPDAHGAIQAVVANFTGGGVAANTGAGMTGAFNPLDFPGEGAVGPAKGTSGGMSEISNLPPTVIAPPDVSNVD